MLTYQIRKRTFRILEGEPPLIFPNDVEVQFFMKPMQPFAFGAFQFLLGFSPNAL